MRIRKKNTVKKTYCKSKKYKHAVKFTKEERNMYMIGRNKKEEKHSQERLRFNSIKGSQLDSVSKTKHAPREGNKVRNQGEVRVYPGRDAPSSIFM